MLADGELLDPRHQYYYARELMTTNNTKSPPGSGAFLNEPDGWCMKNKADACLLLARCHEILKYSCQSAFLFSFSLRPPTC